MTKKTHIAIATILLAIIPRCFSNPVLQLRDPFSFAAINGLPLSETWIPLYFNHAKNIITLIKDKSTGLLSQQGRALALTTKNQLWIKDDLKHIQHIKKMIQHLDQPDTQFAIKARIVMIDQQYQKSIGLQLSDSQQSNADINPPGVTSNTHMESNTITFNVAKFTTGHIINLKLSALEQNGHATLISNPTLITLNNQPASIESGAEVPYEESTSNGATSVHFKKAVLRLKVTPLLLPHKQILLHITLNQDKVSTLTVKGVPAIETQQMNTQVIAHNQQMIILGGILENTRSQQNNDLPLISHIPLFGHLFEHHHHSTTQRVLIICITPSIIEGITNSAKSDTIPL